MRFEPGANEKNNKKTPISLRCNLYTKRKSQSIYILSTIPPFLFGWRGCLNIFLSFFSSFFVFLRERENKSKKTKERERRSLSLFLFLSLSLFFFFFFFVFLFCLFFLFLRCGLFLSQFLFFLFSQSHILSLSLTHIHRSSMVHLQTHRPWKRMSPVDKTLKRSFHIPLLRPFGPPQCSKPFV